MKTVKKAPRLYVTAEMLVKKGACEGDVALFRATFGDKKVFFNRTNWNKAVRAGLSVRWLAGTVLSLRALRAARIAYFQEAKYRPYSNALFDALEARRLTLKVRA